jgi:hypothetical protein
VTAAAPDDLTIGEHLVVPYIRSAKSVQRDDAWSRVFEYVELPGCRIESTSTLEALAALELARVAWILRRIHDGVRPPVPRRPLSIVDIRGRLRAEGVEIPQEVLELRAGSAADLEELARIATVLEGRSRILDRADPWPYDQKAGLPAN